MKDPHALPTDFPRELLSSAEDLWAYNIGGMAWPYPQILEAIAALTERGRVILGGDVFRGQAKALEIVAGDNWYLIRGAEWTWEEYVEASKRKAIEWIEWYHSKFGDGFWYQPVWQCVE